MIGIERMLTLQRCRGDATNGVCQASNLSRHMADMGFKRTSVLQRYRVLPNGSSLVVQFTASHKSFVAFGNVLRSGCCTQRDRKPRGGTRLVGQCKGPILNSS